ncbi:MAG: hypothetical protein IT381_07160 [Deltaproteobacteria bacterium]|nr:hypothetical protein [Deltaproteobacteria bacterium]
MSVVSFAALKTVRQLKQNRAMLVTVLGNLRAMLQKLFESGLVYAREGSRIARDVLLAQEHLSEVLDTLDALAEDTDEQQDEAKRVQTRLAEVATLTQRAAEGIQKLRQAVP